MQQSAQLVLCGSGFVLAVDINQAQIAGTRAWSITTPLDVSSLTNCKHQPCPCNLFPAPLQSLIQPGTKLVVVNFPHNPTGATLEPDDWAALMRRCREVGAWLFSDEMYRFTGKVPPPGRLAEQISLPEQESTPQQAGLHPAFNGTLGHQPMRRAIGGTAWQTAAFCDCGKPGHLHS